MSNQSAPSTSSQVPGRETAAGTLRLKPGRQKPVQNHHPWIFSGAIDRVEGNPNPGDLVQVLDANQNPLAQATFNPHSQISGRIISWDPDEVIDLEFWGRKISRAYAARQKLGFSSATTCYRLIFGEADNFPGLIVDRYGDYLVAQFLTTGSDLRKKLIVDLLKDKPLPDGSRPQAILERSDAAVRQKEKLPLTSGVLWGEPPDGVVTVFENGLAFQVDITSGHKTGFYLDQRDNRKLFMDPNLVEDREILNVFAYTGGFAVCAAAGGARSTLNIDSSFSALELAEANLLANFTDRREQDEYLAGDAFEILRDYRDDGRLFDGVILDPPKFVTSQRDLKRAARGYKDINWLALRLIRPGGILATFSCSGLVSADLFQKIVFGAAIDAGRDVQIMRYLYQAPDHPVAVTFPESAYLKGFLCRIW